MKRASIFILVFIATSVTALAATPQLVDYQGYLMESGVAVNSTKSITFTLYDAASGGALLCSSGPQSLTVTKGVFTHQIGSSGCTLSGIDFDNPVYLELSVEGSILSPRERIAGSAYSVQTKAANVIYSPAGNISSTDVQSAIAELDSEKLSLTGGTVAGTVTATAFAGDGNALTNINAGALDHGTISGLADDDHPQYLNLSQDEVINGSLGLAQSAATGTIYAYQTGATGDAGYFEINAGSGNGRAVGAYTNGDAFSVAVEGRNTGTGRAGAFSIDNAGNSSNTVLANHNGTGTLYKGNHTGASGNLLQLQKAGVDKFVVDIDGKLTVGGNIYNISDTGQMLWTSSLTPYKGAYILGNSAGYAGTPGNLYLTHGDNSAAAPASSILFRYADNGAITNQMAILSSGDVGIGTDTPSNKLEVQNTGANMTAYFNTNNAGNANAVVDARTNGTGNLYYGNQTGTGGLLRLDKSGAAQLVVNTSGNMSIGTGAAVNKLDVEGAAAIGATYSGASTAPANGLIVQGNLGVGTPTPAATLEVAGDIRSNNMTCRGGCGTETWIDVAGGTGWGSWSGRTYCPAYTYMCGLEQRVEADQGTGDDTAVNDIGILCCPF